MGELQYFLAVLISLQGFTFVRTGQLPLQNLCPSPEGGNVTYFGITETDALPGNFIRGKAYTVRLDYLPGTNSSFTRVKCGTVVLGQPQTAADWDACGDLHMGCPVKAFEVTSYRATIRVPQVPPGMYPLYCEFLDEAGVKQLCVAGNARIVLW